METGLHEALHRAVLAGIKDVKPDRIGGDLKGKPLKALLARLVEANYLVANRKNYDLTPEGRLAWEQADPAAAQAWKDAQAALLEKQIIQFLKVVQEARGSKLKKPQLGAVSADAIAEAQARKLVGPGVKEGTYQLLQGGVLLLLAEQPVEDQVRELRQMAADLETRFARVTASVARQLPNVPDENNADLATSTRDRLQAILATLQAELGRLESIPVVIHLREEARRSVEAAVEEAEKQIEARLALVQQLTELSRQVKQDLHTQQQARAEFQEARAAFQEALRPYFERLERLAKEQPTPPRPQEPEPKPVGPTPEQLWDATRMAYTALRRQGAVKVPELTDAVLQQYPTVSAEQYHRQLQSWHSADRVVLEAANSANAELRASEGIRSSRGLLFYVHVN